MVGFILIIILVAVILLIFLGFSVSKSSKSSIKSYEVEGFIQAFLQYTTTCSEYDGSDYFSVQDLIFECSSDETCSNGQKTCVVLNDTLKQISEQAWQVGQDRPNKGYELSIKTKKTEDSIESLIYIQQGNITRSYKGANQVLSKKRTNFEIAFKIYF